MPSDGQPHYIQPLAETVLIREDFTADLHLTNLTTQTIMFKIRTTAPNHYVVKPHFGTIQPNAATNVRIIMKRTDIHSLPAFLKDKFQINAVYTPENVDPAVSTDPNIFQRVWDQMPKQDKQSTSVRVSFALIPESIPGDQHSQLLKKDPANGLYNQHLDSLANRLETIREEEPEVFASVQLPKSEARVNQSESLTEDNEEAGEKDGEERYLEAKIAAMQKDLESIVTEIDAVRSSNDDLLAKASKQEKLLDELLREKQSIKEELENTKTSAFKSAGASKAGIDIPQSYQLWHIVLIVVVSFLIGSVLSA